MGKSEKGGVTQLEDVGTTINSRGNFIRRTPELAMAELSDAYETWKALPEAERGEFNNKWLQENCGTLERWMYLHGGIKSFVKQVGGDLEKDFKKREVVRDRTPESARVEFKAAHAAWKALPEAERGEFSTHWLQINCNNLYAWMNKNGGIKLFIKSAGGDLEKDFYPRRTPESALAELKAAYEKWKSLPKDERGKFNQHWLVGNEHALSKWIRKNGGLDSFIKQAGGDVEKDFEKMEMVRGRTSETAIIELRAAHAAWKALPEAEQGKFNTKWVRDNFLALVGWMESRGGVQKYIVLAGGDVEKDFEKREVVRGRTPESALAELKVAHETWKALPEAERGKFNKYWVTKYDQALDAWFERHGGLDSFVKQAGGDLERDFIFVKIVNRRSDRTPESALAELKVAHETWKALPEAERGKFNKYWINKNDQRLSSWLESHGGVESFVKQAGGDVEKDFEKREVVRGRTPESALAELKVAHETWKVLQEDERGIFNKNWLAENYTGLHAWMSRHGGVESFVKQAGGDLEQDFGKINDSEKQSKENIKKIAQEISEGQTEMAQHIRKLIEFFGGSSALNILYKFHPEFKSLPVEYVKSCLVDYLGDFLSAKNNFNLDNINLAVEMLSDPDCQDCAYKAIKNHCLKYYYEQRRSGAFQDGLSIIHAYLDHVLVKMEGVSNKFLDDIIQKVLEFYNSALRDFKKPEQFVDRLSEGRDFPDINQRVNMKELADNKRMLIADEMGLGKSASVIMAKEQLGIPCALVVAPSNVIDTWAGYLSDDEKKGYFKKGEAPRVLIIESPKQLVGISKDDYDYILISQEKMVPRYTKPLEEMDIDMMVVDEVHKIKNVHGVRTQSFLPLAKKMEGDNKYLAMLSGTPAPNKVKDIAIILKLLYPEEFAEIEDTDLVRSIIRGDIANLSSLLMLRMQMKNLEDSVEMPELTQEVVSIEMSSLEKDIYEVLLEEDEFTAQEKLHVLRQFLLNPHLLDSTPGLESCKIKALEQELQHAFETKSKVVLFANIDIENIIRGDNSILGRLNLPPDVEVRVIEGDPKKKKYRKGIQDEFNEDNGKKILLVVSGETADVGVNFTGGEEVVFYNEPWTEADRRQQLARVYRPGQEKPIVAKTLIVKNTIEEGIHSYIQAKYKAIEKLLRGVPLNDLEKVQLAKDEKFEDKSAEINREWAEYFFSSVEMMNKMFGAVKNIGEERFRKFLEEYGARYAEAYRDLGSRSYQSNSNRVTGTLISNMVEKSGKNPNELAILDVASGPEMLRRHIVDNLQDSVHSLDINPEHFDKNSGNKYVGSWTKMPFEDKSFDYLNLAMSLHYSEFAPSKGKFERVELLKEMNRVLKEGGRVVISMIYSLQLKDMEKFEKFVEALGFKIVGDYSGIAESDVNFRSQVLTLEKVKDIDKTAQQIVSEVGEENSAGLKFDRIKIKLKNQRRVLRSFLLDGKGKPVEHNSGDRKIMEEEVQITNQGTQMKAKHGSIKGIPVEEIIETNFVRILPKNRYMLFKRLISGPGAVVIKDSDKIEDGQK